MEQVKEKIINKVLLITVVFLAIPYSLSLIRSLQIGWQNITYFHTFVFISLILVFVYKAKLSVAFKTQALSVLSLIVITSYSIHYTKLYEKNRSDGCHWRRTGCAGPACIYLLSDHKKLLDIHFQHACRRNCFYADGTFLPHSYNFV